MTDSVRHDPMHAEVVEHAYASTHADGAALALEENGRVICCARAGERAPSLGAELDREAGISGLCLREGEAVRCDDAAADSRVDSAAAGRLGIRSILAVPLKSRGVTIGLLEVFSQTPQAFGAEDEALLQIAAERIVNRQEDISAPLLPFAEWAGVPTKPDSIVLALCDAATSEPPKIPVSESAFASVDAPASATDWKRRLAMWIAGFAMAGAVALVFLLHTGAGPHKSPPTPVVTQAQLLRRAAESGESSAQYELAMRYRSGDGVERNYGEAVRWLKDAARRGNGDAQYELGNAYADGRGIARDPIAAYACYVLAGANGSLASEEALRFLTPKLTGTQVAEVRETIGQMYLQGRGTPVDLVAAYAWFSLAASAGNVDAGLEKQMLASKMSSNQIAEANRRAIDWMRRHRQRARRQPIQSGQSMTQIDH